MKLRSLCIVGMLLAAPHAKAADDAAVPAPAEKAPVPTPCSKNQLTFSGGISAYVHHGFSGGTGVEVPTAPAVGIGYSRLLTDHISATLEANTLLGDFWGVEALNAYGLWNFRDVSSRVRPFAGLGVSMLLPLNDAQPLNDSVQFVSLLGGVKIPFHGNLGLQLEGRLQGLPGFTLDPSLLVIQSRVGLYTLF